MKNTPLKPHSRITRCSHGRKCPVCASAMRQWALSWRTVTDPTMKRACLNIAIDFRDGECPHNPCPSALRLTQGLEQSRKTKSTVQEN